MFFSYIARRDILNVYYTSYLIGLVVIFVRSVFDLFGCMVRNLAVRIPIYSALCTTPNQKVDHLHARLLTSLTRSGYELGTGNWLPVLVQGTGF